MKLLIALLFTLCMTNLALAKVSNYFELGTSLQWSKSEVTGVNRDIFRNIILQVTKGYIFKEHWDISAGVRYAKLSEDQVRGDNVKQYAAQFGVKYLFGKYPGLIRNHHKAWMTPYVGLAYQWRRLSPHGVPNPQFPGTLVPELVVKTLEPGYLISAGIRYFVKKNLAITWDLSYRKAKRVTTNKANGTELASDKVTDINPSLSFVYFF